MEIPPPERRQCTACLNSYPLNLFRANERCCRYCESGTKPHPDVYLDTTETQNQFISNSTKNTNSETTQDLIKNKSHAKSELPSEPSAENKLNYRELKDITNHSVVEERTNIPTVVQRNNNNTSQSKAIEDKEINSDPQDRIESNTEQDI